MTKRERIAEIIRNGFVDQANTYNIADKILALDKELPKLPEKLKAVDFHPETNLLIEMQENRNVLNHLIDYLQAREGEE